MLASQKLENKYREILQQKNSLKSQLVDAHNEIESANEKLIQIQSIILTV